MRVYDNRQKRLRYVAVTFIVFLIVSMVIIVFLEFYWHIEAR